MIAHITTCQSATYVTSYLPTAYESVVTQSVLTAPTIAATPCAPTAYAYSHAQAPTDDNSVAVTPYAPTVIVPVKAVVTPENNIHPLLQ